MKNSIYETIVHLPKPAAKLITDISDFSKDPKLCMENRRQIRSFFKAAKSGPPLSHAKSWEQGLLYYALSSPRAARKIADNFCNCRLTCLKKEQITADTGSPVFLTVVKDDLERIKLSYEHHKSIGVESFVYIDNGSTDGTLEYLMSKPVTVYQTTDDFIMWAKVAWISRVIDSIGFHRWYLILDSDELFVYPGCEKTPIQAYVRKLSQKKCRSTQSFMLDMYAKAKLFEGAKTAEDIKREFRYFDTDSYKETYCLHYKKVLGGPRERVFGNPDSMEMLQNKYALVYYEKKDIYRYHYVCPYDKNFEGTCSSALLHYKFIGGDYEKYTEIARKGNYANGSRLYKDVVHVMEEKKELSFYHEKSAEYQTSEDLLLHPLIHEWRK